MSKSTPISKSCPLFRRGVLTWAGANHVHCLEGEYWPELVSMGKWPIFLQFTAFHLIRPSCHDNAYILWSIWSWIKFIVHLALHAGISDATVHRQHTQDEPNEVFFLYYIFRFCLYLYISYLGGYSSIVWPVEHRCNDLDSSKTGRCNTSSLYLDISTISGSPHHICSKVSSGDLPDNWVHSKTYIPTLHLHAKIHRWPTLGGSKQMFHYHCNIHVQLG